jgi:hypothetical protein
MEAFIVIDESTPRVIAGTYQFDRASGGVLVAPSGTEFPAEPHAQEVFWRKDERKLYRRNDGNTAWEAVLADTPTVPMLVQEYHLVTSGEVTAGYFALTGGTPMDANTVSIKIYRGIEQVNKPLAGATGATPDFELQSSNHIHFNGNGGATGLSGDIVVGTVLQISYVVEAV